MESNEKSKALLFIKKQTCLQKLSVNEILYAQSDGNYCNLYTENEKHIINLSLTKLLQKLSSDYFLRIHKRFLINIEAVEVISLATNELFIGNKKLPIGRSYKEQIINRIVVLN